MHPRFAPVRDCFHDLFAAGRETGAGLTIWYDGHPVVDLVGGSRGGARPARRPATRRSTRGGRTPWSTSTRSASRWPRSACCCSSTGAGSTWTSRWPRYWPGFRTPATVRQVLSHTAGLPAFPVPRPAAAIADWELLCADLAAAEPEWAPGSSRASTPGRTGTWWASWSAGWTAGRWAGSWPRRSPARGASTSASGSAAADQRRCADLSYGDPEWPTRVLGEPGSLRARALGNPAGGLDLAVLNSPLWRGAEVPAVNLHATAAALARLYAGLLAGGTLDGVRLFSPELVAEATRVQYDGAGPGAGPARPVDAGHAVGAGRQLGHGRPRRQFAPGRTRSAATPSRTPRPGWPSTTGWTSWSRPCTPACDRPSAAVRRCGRRGQRADRGRAVGPGITTGASGRGEQGPRGHRHPPPLRDAGPAATNTS